MPDPRFKAIDIKVGILLFIVFALLLSSFTYMVIHKNLFAIRVHYSIISDTGEDLSQGMPVKFAGYQIGEVKNIILQKDGEVKADIYILKRYKQWIQKDTRFNLTKKGFIGSPMITVLNGKGKPAAEGTIFHLRREGGLNALIKKGAPVLKNLSETAVEIKKFVKGLNAHNAKISSILSSIRESMTNLNKGSGAAGYLMSDNDSKVKVKKILNGFVKIEDNLNRLILNLDKTVRITQKDAVDAGSGILKLNVVIKHIDNVITGKLVPILNDLHKTTGRLPLTDRKVNQAVDLTNELLLKLHHTWPLNSSKKTNRLPELPLP